jgi:acyl carrier protein phosphodiesterase
MYDHFLAKNWSNYHKEDLFQFAQYVYGVMEDNVEILPEKFLHILPRMKEENWLYEYQFLDGMTKAFEGISRRANFESNMALAGHDLVENYEELERNFVEFFNDLIFFVQDKGIYLIK